MKAILYTTFIETVERQGPASIAERIVADAQLPSGGGCASVPPDAAP